MRRNTREEAEALRAEAIEDPLCACRVLPNGQVVPSNRAIKAADEAARQLAARHEKRSNA